MFVPCQQIYVCTLSNDISGLTTDILSSENRHLIFNCCTVLLNHYLNIVAQGGHIKNIKKTLVDYAF